MTMEKEFKVETACRKCRAPVVLRCVYPQSATLLVELWQEHLNGLCEECLQSEGKMTKPGLARSMPMTSGIELLDAMLQYATATERLTIVRLMKEMCIRRGDFVQAAQLRDMQRSLDRGLNHV
jgi:hypothetical protein